MQMAGLRAHAAFNSCGAAEHGIPLSCTQPGGGGGHGLPSGVTHDGQTGAACAGAANATARTAAAVMMASLMAHSSRAAGVDGRGGGHDGVHGRASVLLGRGEHFHVSMLHVPFGPWQRARANSQGDV
jgi:hypothetical protein